MMKISNAWRGSLRRGGILGILATTTSLLLSSFAVLGTSTMASALPSPWGTMSLPQPAPDDNTHFAVDGAGNIYTIPPSYDINFNCYTTGISVYSPSSATTTFLDPSGTNFCGAYFAVTQSGTVYVVNPSGTIFKVDPNGTESVYGVVPYEGPIAVDGAGNVYVASVNYPDSTIYKFTNGSGVVMGTVAGTPLYSIAVGPDGSVYGVDYGYSSHLYVMTPSGSVSTVGSYLSQGEGVTVDGAGNVYVADEGGSVIEFSATGTVGAVAGYPSSCPEAAAIGGSTMYVYDECTGSTIFTYNVVALVSAPLPALSLMAQSSIATINSKNTQTVTASWTGSAYATSYTCTLMYGFNFPSTFSKVTTTTSCSFDNLTVGVEYGIRVVANNGSSSSSPMTQFAMPAKPPVKSIICARGSSRKRVTAVNPVCPAGYHRV